MKPFITPLLRLSGGVGDAGRYRWDTGTRRQATPLAAALRLSGSPAQFNWFISTVLVLSHHLLVMGLLTTDSPSQSA